MTGEKLGLYSQFRFIEKFHEKTPQNRVMKMIDVEEITLEKEIEEIPAVKYSFIRETLAAKKGQSLNKREKLPEKKETKKIIEFQVLIVRSFLSSNLF